MVIKLKLICHFCKKEFEAKRKDAKYCSNSCRNKASRHNRGLIGKPCLICGEKFSPLTQSANKRKVCYNCIPDGETITRGKYIELIKTKIYNGKCIRCGYDKCISALEFHHIDPTKKDTIISLFYMSEDEIISYAKNFKEKFISKVDDDMDIFTFYNHMSELSYYLDKIHQRDIINCMEIANAIDSYVNKLNDCNKIYDLDDYFNNYNERC